MNPIPITSCHHCKPKLWKVVSEGRGPYKCKTCGRVINQILKRKKGEENGDRKTNKSK